MIRLARFGFFILGISLPLFAGEFEVSGPTDHHLFDETGIIKTVDGRIHVIVQFDDPPLVNYNGGQRGLPATNREATGTARIQIQTPEAQAYREWLRQRRVNILSQARSVGVVINRSYDILFNGVSTVLAPEQIPLLRNLPGVQAIYPDTLVKTNLDASLDLIRAPQAWAALGGQTNAGAGVIVAVIDSGVRPENPMFDGAGFSFPPGFPLPDSYCGEDGDPSFCNGKIVNARWYAPNFVTSPLEYMSPLAFDGHGVHVAGAAVGNAGTVADTSDGFTEVISGVAPGAWLSVYKALFSFGPTAVGSNSMLISALEDAVADGAHVINNSWGGGPGTHPQNSPITQTVENAVNAGVVVVFAAGNDGPGQQTIGCPGCVESAITVGNSTTNRRHMNIFNLNSPSPVPPELQEIGVLQGSGFQLEQPLSARLISAAAIAGNKGCTEFPQNSFSGGIALIERGDCDFVNKVFFAWQAGALAVFVFNNQPGPPIVMGTLDGIPIPAFMMSQKSGLALEQMLVDHPGEVVGRVETPIVAFTDDDWQNVMAPSSSRGPNGDPDVIKPDVTAPGTRILSAFSPDQSGDFAFLSGTSMASPHVAGAAALILQQHPDWTPDQVKTALMATANPEGIRKEDFITPADPFDFGSGKVEVDQAIQAQLTFDKASIAEDRCVALCSWTRTIKNETDSTQTWIADIQLKNAAIDAAVTPSEITLAPGEQASFEIAINAALAPMDQWIFGSLEWRNTHSREGEPAARLPIALTPTRSDEPDSLIKTVDKTNAAAGETLTYTVNLTNIGEGSDVVITDPIPDNATFIPDSVRTTVDNNPASDISFDPKTRMITWQDKITRPELSIMAEPFSNAFTPIGDFDVPPLPCTSVCDDAFISLPDVDIKYMGRSYDNVIMSTNGYLILGDDITSAFSAVNQAFPDPTAPNNILAPFFTDLDMDGTSSTDTGAGTWYTAIINDNTTEWYVFEWNGVATFGKDTQTHDFQIWAEIGTDNIWFVYGNLSEAPPLLTVGAENDTGTIGYLYFNDGAGTLPTSNSALHIFNSGGSTAVLTYQVSVNQPEQSGVRPPPVINIASATLNDQPINAFAATIIQCVNSQEFFDALPRWGQDLNILNLIGEVCD